jgi:transcription termination factor Rho
MATDITTDRAALGTKLLPELQAIAQSLGVDGAAKLRKAGLIDAIVEAGGNGAPSPGAAATADAGNGGASTATSDPADTNGGEGAETRADRPDRTSAAQRPDRDGGRDAADRGDGERGGDGPRDRGGDRGGDRGPDTRGDRGDRDSDGRRRRPSREERRRQRDERRQREEAQIAEEMANAPSQEGILDMLPEGYGFLRTSGYLPGPDDIYVSVGQIRKHALRKGDVVSGKARRARENEKYPALLAVDTVNGVAPEKALSRPQFDKLTPLFPDERFRLENAPTAVSERIIDMVAPIGKGQRGMVVSPPKAGKTTILKQIANGIIASAPDTHVMVLLVDERPEEVTDWQRTVSAAEVVYSTFDKPTDQHIQVTELVLERAKRLAEQGQDVAIILDSLTRLARAYNLGMPASGKILTGGIDASALYPPRRFFGAARNIEEGGSVTIIASALVETGSRMDDGIFEEFKGTGNMELRLDRQLSEKRLFPAINVDASGTRKEELLLPPDELALVIKLRRVLHALEPGAALELLIDKLRATKSNEQFLKEIAKAPAGG